MKTETKVKYTSYFFYALIVVGITAITWIMGVVFSDSISDHTVIKPVNGVECVVVSRMFNTSVDCWKVRGEGE